MFVISPVIMELPLLVYMFKEITSSFTMSILCFILCNYIFQVHTLFLNSINMQDKFGSSTIVDLYAFWKKFTACSYIYKKYYSTKMCFCVKSVNWLPCDIFNNFRNFGIRKPSCIFLRTRGCQRRLLFRTILINIYTFRYFICVC